MPECAVCGKNPVFGLVKGKPTHCRKHKEPEMKDVVNQTCAECGKRPSFGLVRGKPTHCRKHKKPEMKNVVSKRCAECDKHPAFGLVKGKPTHCRDHKKTEMRNVVSKTCAECDTHPTFGLVRGKPTHCLTHKTPEMTDVINKKCAECGKQPVYGLVRGKPTHCIEHKLTDMKDVMSKTCADCEKHPTFGLVRGKPTHCLTHKSPDMTDVMNKPCKTPLCTTQVSNPAYKGLCYPCFIHTFPDSPILRNHKTKERTVVDFLGEAFPDVPWVLDKRVAGGCSGRRPDLYADLGTALLCVEVDEQGHRSYLCENRRLMELFEDGGRIPIMMVRFNPDAYVREDGTRVPSCWGVTGKGLCAVKRTRKDDWESRLEALRQTVQEMIDRAADPLQLKEVDEMRLFYGD